MDEALAIPGLSEILEPMFTKYEMVRDHRYDVVSTRRKKDGIGMKTWKGGGCEVFVYDDNTLGLRSWTTNEVEVDLSAANPDFLVTLETWISFTQERKKNVTVQAS